MYNLFTLRQASRRSWRIGQRRECRVYYLYYDGTMQAAAMALMGRKMQAAQALEGKFSTDGLVALSGDDATVEMALAQSLDSLLPGDAARTWGMVGAEGSVPECELPAGPESDTLPLHQDRVWLDDLEFEDIDIDAELGGLEEFLGEEEEGEEEEEEADEEAGSVEDPEVAAMLADFFE